MRSVNFRILGIPARVSVDFLLTALVIGVLQRSTDLILPTMFWAFLVVLTQQLGHALTAKAFGEPTEIILHALGGSTRYLEGRLGRWSGMLTSLAGPTAGLLLSLGLWIGARPISERSEHVAETVKMLSAFGAGFSLLNLLPILPFAGGMAMQHALGPARQQLTLWLSTAFAVALTLVTLKLGLHPLLMVMFGLAAMQSARAAWSFRELRAQLILHAQAARAALERARSAWGRGSMRETETKAAEALGLAVEADVRDEARRLLIAVNIEAGEGDRALALLGTIESSESADDVLRAQALDLVGERETAFTLLEHRAVETPTGPALMPLVQGLLATGQLDRAARVGEKLTQSGPLDALSLLATELHERGELGASVSLSLALLKRTGDGRFGVLAARSKARRGEYDGALEALERAVAAGFRDADHIERQAELSPLHDDPRYSKLLAGLGAS